MTASGRTRPAANAPKFVSGSVLRHILEMTGTGALGLMAIFIGDLANIYFLSLSGEQSTIAAVGYASSILYFVTSIGIGLSIASSAMVAPAIGAGRRAIARRLSTHAHLLTFFVSALMGIVLWFFIPQLLTLLGAQGAAHVQAGIYLAVLVPTLPLLALAMTSSSVLRSVGDAKRAMFVTLSGAGTNIVLDALLIVHYGMGIEGAAIASACARCVIVAIGLYGVGRIHKLLAPVKPMALSEDARMFLAVAVPAVLTNIATPIGNAFVTRAVAPFGDGAVAGWAIIGRIIPVAFGAIYALSGSVGPIIGQNFGARLPERMRTVLTQSLIVMAVFTGVAWIGMMLTADILADSFNATGEARELIVFFCRWLSPLFVFLGAIFIANAAFNTLGQPHVSTLLNWGRATVGTIPLVQAGASLDGARGAMTGNMAAGVLFGVLSVYLAYRLIGRIDHSLRKVALD